MLLLKQEILESDTLLQIISKKEKVKKTTQKLFIHIQAANIVRLCENVTWATPLF